MLRRLATALLCVSALVCTVHFAAASVALRVDESKSRFFFDDRHDEKARVVLLVVNPTARPFVAHSVVELLDTEDRVRASGNDSMLLAPGANIFTTEVPFSVSQVEDEDKLPWYRLRYRVEPEGKAPAALAEGVVSLSAINPDFFELKVSGAHAALDGMRYRARVRATHPATGAPVKGVRVTAEVDAHEEGDAKRRTTATTDAAGYATLDLQLPRRVGEDHFDVEVTGRLNGVERSASDEVKVERVAEVLLGTDKPIYQPGQTLHVRALVRDALAGAAVADAEVTFSIDGPDYSRVFKASARTSRFGVASIDWPIPEGTRLGDYRVRAEAEGDTYDDAQSLQVVRISRYELPNFSVKVEPDRKFYLPGQNAEVTVRADYLFGKPVTRGRVRVAREASREWDYSKQKWIVTEEESFEGETDAEGRFVARIDLTKSYEELSSNDDARYIDRTYAAYFTDPTTNRTEQRRFDLRATQDALHVYVVKPRYDEGQTEGMPLEFYVSTFYADGTPASCAVEVREKRAAAQVALLNALPSSPPAPVLAEVRTNDFGFAKIDGLLLEDARLNEDDEVTLEISAHDATGGRGNTVEAFNLAERTVIRVETDKIIHRPGEPVRARIVSNRQDLPVAFDVMRGRKVIYSGSARLRGGSASVVIPYRREFRNELTVAAYTLPGAHDYDDPDAGARTIVYPRGRELRFDVRLDKEEYRPGEEASAEVSVRDPEGRAVEGALGVVVTDRAVDERARTDREFGQGSLGGGFTDDVLGRLGAADGLAGVTRRDLVRLDLTKPLPVGLDLVAEVLLNRDAAPGFNTFGDGFARNQRVVFANALAERLRPLGEALDRKGLRDDYPRDESALRRELEAAGVRLEELRDPWGSPFRVWFGTQQGEDVLEVVTASADKEAGTGDDFIALRRGWPYFHNTAQLVERALRRRREQTRELIRDRETLTKELLTDGLDFAAVRDRWGQPYELETETKGWDFILRLKSSGPDMRFGSTRRRNAPDDFIISTARVNYFKDVERAVNSALDRALERGERLPLDDAALRALLAREGFDEKLLLDTWGRPYNISFVERPWVGGKPVIRSYARHGERPQERVEYEALPGSKLLHTLTFKSSGPDGIPSWDDLRLHTFTRLLDPPVVNGATPTTTRGARMLNVSHGHAQTGSVMGIVLDSNGGAVTGVFVRAVRGGLVYAATQTDDGGAYLLAPLAPETYEIQFESTGFVQAIITNVVVKAGAVTNVDASLQPGAVSEVVNVMADTLSIEPSRSASMLTESRITNLPIDGRQLNLFALSPGAKQAAATPRLREYFPETLVWRPAIETDADGRARFKFKLADNITTWKMTLVGSTIDGQLGVAEHEVRAFQPFFAEHDPPRVLTEGDEISLPVVLRNYLERAQDVDVEMKPESWFALTGPARRSVRVPAGDAARAVFDLRAVASVREGKQRVTALGREESDAIEKPVSVHPDGDALTGGETNVFSGAGALDFSFPASTIKNSARAELKVYPSLMSHVIEGVEAIMQRPYGCGEQTISSTYPSLLVLRHYRLRGAGADALPATARKADQYVRAGYERLLGYENGGGGFGYWSGGQSNLALTAYALRFLRDASEVAPVDDEVIERTRAHLVGQQNPNGSWGEYASDAPGLTAYIARVLAAYELSKRAAQQTGNANAPNQPSPPQSAEDKKAAETLKRALDFLARHAAESSDPYALASYVLAAAAVGRTDDARAAAAKLVALRKDEAGESFWEPKGNTPFYGWGLAGRIETTALAVRALSTAAPSSSDAAGRGLIYLLRHKDEHGVWHSTQATVNVLDALTTLPPNSSRDSQSNTTGGAAEVFVNGRHVSSLAIPSGGDVSAPLTLDITPHVNAPGRNRVEVRQTSGGPQSAAQVVTSYYVPWGDSPNVALLTRGGPTAAAAVGAPPAPASAAGRPVLRVSYDRTEGAAAQPITCRVQVSRGDSRGYGMLLAEVGLPPGAEVDRGSLERARAQQNGLDSYDVLPDRIVLYVWPYAADGINFEFKFTPRYALRALTAPSQIYDYYNPESRTVVPPTRFVIR